MRARNKFAAAFSGAVLMAAGGVAMTATPAMAATPTGGCWVYSAAPSSAVDSTDTSAGELSSALAAWGPGAVDYTLTTSGGSGVGDNRDLSLVFNTGPQNGGPAASGTAYYYFAVGGTNLAPVTKAFSAPGFNPIPGDTVNGSFTIPSGGTQTVTFRKVIYDIPSFGLRVQCNGQTSGTVGAAGVNPATTPVNTNITTSFQAFAAANAAINAVSNQTVTTHARSGDVISFTGSSFSAAGAGTAELCDTTGANCSATTSSFTVDAAGTGTGTITVPASFAGAKALKLSSGGEVGLRPVTVLDSPTLTANLSGGGSGTTVTLTGTNWDPGQSVSIGGFASGPPFPPPATADAPVSVNAGANGSLSAQFTVNAANTAAIGAQQTHRTPPIFSSTAFSFSGDTCTAKVGAAATGSCSLMETVTLAVTAGDLKMSKDAGSIVMSGVSLNGSAQTSTGSLQDVKVMDYRGGTLGWSLTATFSGLNGPVAIAPDQMEIAPSCVNDANNDDSVVTGSAATFADATTALPLCTVSTGGLGADLVSGGDTAADAGLSLDLLPNQAAGNYTGTLTITLS